MKIAGLSVAYRAKLLLQKNCDVVINYGGLDAIIDQLSYAVLLLFDVYIQPGPSKYSNILWIILSSIILLSTYFFLTKKNISKNGILFIEVPSVEKKNDYRTFTKTPHAYNYTAKSLQNIIEKSGYEIISCDWFGPPSKVNGAINKLSKKLLNRDFYPYYPKMLTGKYSGEDIRVISQLKSKN